jgi:hypothetical protein
MPKVRKHVAQPIGFFTGQAPQGARPPYQQNPYMRPPIPYTNQQNPFMPNAGGPFPPQQVPPSAPPSGLGGFLQGLTEGKGVGDIQGFLSNAQKMMGAFNQASDVFKQVSPMLQMLKGLNVSEIISQNDDVLKEIGDEEGKTKPKKRKRRKRKRKSRMRRRR